MCFRVYGASEWCFSNGAYSGAMFFNFAANRNNIVKCALSSTLSFLVGATFEQPGSPAHPLDAKVNVVQGAMLRLNHRLRRFIQGYAFSTYLGPC